MGEKIKHALKEGTEMLTVLEGQAVVEQKPNELHISGNISACSDFLAKKKYEAETAHVLLKLTERLFILKLNEKDSNGMLDVIEGKLEVHPIHSELKVNGGTMGRADLIDLLRRNRHWFRHPDAVRDLIVSLRNLMIKVDKVMHNEDDLAGNTLAMKQSRIAEISADINLKLTAYVPLFKGQLKERYEYEYQICLDVSGNGVSFYIQSDDWYELIEKEAYILIEEEHGKLEEFGCSIVTSY
jgi:hypothetical protein